MNNIRDYLQKVEDVRSIRNKLVDAYAEISASKDLNHWADDIDIAMDMLDEYVQLLLDTPVGKR